jgi:enoyl-CoA hydratase/carnithine racemase
MSDRVRIDVDGGLARVTLTRPDKHNAVDFEMLDAVVAAQADLRAREGLRAVILRGEGPSFCSGLDFKSVLANRRRALAGYASLWSPMRNDFQRWSMGWRGLAVPVIAVVHGNCFGAGIQLALGADIRIAAPDAKLSIMEAKWGLIPDMGGAALLRELIRIDIAKELTLTGRILSGEAAHALGLVTHVSAEPLKHAEALAEEIAARSPDAVAAGKFLMQRAWSEDESGALAAERRRQRQLFGSANQRIAIKRNLGSGGSEGAQDALKTPYQPGKIRR